MIKIAVDAMGGDYAPEITCLGVKKYLETAKNDVHINLYGDMNKIKNYITDFTRITVIDTLDYLEMDEKKALSRLRTDNTSSLYLSLKALKDGECQGMVGASPTGAIVSYSQLIVKKIKGIRKVAVTAEGQTGVNPHKFLLLDAGANISITSENVYQFAKSGAIYAKEALKIENPSVVILCNGVEKGKGREIEREVYDMLENDKSINFKGYVESCDILDHPYDVIVSDGFSANLVMKAVEGSLKSFGKEFKKAIKSSFKNKIAYMLMKSSLKEIFNRFGQKGVGGAILLGINGVVIKAHGNSNAESFADAIKQTEAAIRNDIIKKISISAGALDD